MDSRKLKAEKGAFLLTKVFHTLEAFAASHTGMKTLIGQSFILSLYGSVVSRDKGRTVVETCFQTSASLIYSRLGLLNTLLENSKKNKGLILAIKGTERELVKKLFRTSDGISQSLLVEILWRLVIPQRKSHNEVVAAASVAFQPISDLNVRTHILKAFLMISPSKQDSKGSSGRKKLGEVESNHFESSIRSFLLMFNQLRPQMSSSKNRLVYSFLVHSVQFDGWKSDPSCRSLWLDVGVFNLTIKIPDRFDGLLHYPVSLPIRKISDYNEEVLRSTSGQTLSEFTLSFAFSRSSDEALENFPLIPSEFWEITRDGKLKMVLEMVKEDGAKFGPLLEARLRHEPSMSLNSSTASTLSNALFLPRFNSRTNEDRRNSIAATIPSTHKSVAVHLFHPQAIQGPVSSSPIRGSPAHAAKTSKRATIATIPETTYEEFSVKDRTLHHTNDDHDQKETINGRHTEEMDDELVVKFRKTIAISSPQAPSPTSKTSPSPSKTSPRTHSVASSHKSPSSVPRTPSPMRTSLAAQSPTTAPTPSKSPSKSPKKVSSKSNSPSNHYLTALETRRTNQPLSEPSKTPSPLMDSSISRVSPSSDSTMHYGTVSIRANDATPTSPPGSSVPPSPSKSSHREYTPIPIAAEIDFENGTMVPSPDPFKQHPKRAMSPPSTDDSVRSDKKRSRMEMTSTAILEQGLAMNVDSDHDNVNLAETDSEGLLNIFSPSPKKQSPIIDKSTSKRTSLPISSKVTSPKIIETTLPRAPIFQATLSQRSSPTADVLSPNHLERSLPHHSSVMASAEAYIATAEKPPRAISTPAPPAIVAAPAHLHTPNSPTLQHMARVGLHHPKGTSNEDPSVDVSISLLAKKLDFSSNQTDIPVGVSKSMRKVSSATPLPNPSNETFNPNLQKNVDQLMKILDDMRKSKVTEAEERRDALKKRIDEFLTSTSAHLSDLIDSSSLESFEALNSVAEQHRLVLSKFIRAATSQLSRL